MSAVVHPRSSLMSVVVHPCSPLMSAVVHPCSSLMSAVVHPRSPLMSAVVRPPSSTALQCYVGSQPGNAEERLASQTCSSATYQQTVVNSTVKVNATYG